MLVVCPLATHQQKGDRPSGALPVIRSLVVGMSLQGRPGVGTDGTPKTYIRKDAAGNLPETSGLNEVV